MSGEDLPQPTYMQYALVAYAAVRGELPFVRQRRMYRLCDPPELLGAFPGVALYADPDGTMAIAYCDEAWTVVIFDDSYASLDEARARTEAEYPGISARWTPSPYTAADCEAAWSEGACSFCRRRRYEFEGALETDHGKVVCGVCLSDVQSLPLSQSEDPCGFCGRDDAPFDASILHGVVFCDECLAGARSFGAPKVCSLCGAHSDDFDACISNDRVVICTGCLAGTQPREVSGADSCSFCGRRGDELGPCVGNDRLVLCDHCFAEVQPILGECGTVGS